MSPRGSFLTHWYYHVPDLILAVLIYLLIARLVLGLILRGDGDRLAVRALNRITDPVLAGVGAITPRVVPLPLVIAIAVAWLAALRLALFIAVTAQGIRLALG
jgi:pheromone shutdown protein TraB